MQNYERYLSIFKNSVFIRYKLLNHEITHMVNHILYLKIHGRLALWELNDE